MQGAGVLQGRLNISECCSGRLDHLDCFPPTGPFVHYAGFPPRRSTVKHKSRSSIIAHLLLVEKERTRRDSLPLLRAAVQALKLYQQRRFEHTYADLLSTQRYGAAARFFLDELYGPSDFRMRDAQFIRVAPALTRLFPSELVHTVETLARLHSISESLDSCMGERLLQTRIDPEAYIRAWQSTGRQGDRETQIALTLEIGAALDHYTRRPMLRQTLRMMRGPARAAGLPELQRFLEAGFDAFKTMNGAGDFLAIIAQRERKLAQTLFRIDPSGQPVRGLDAR